MNDIRECGFKWHAPRVPTPGVPSGYHLVPGGVVANPTRVAQVCSLPKGHEGDHRSAHGVIARPVPEGFFDDR